MNTPPVVSAAAIDAVAGGRTVSVGLAVIEVTIALMVMYRAGRTSALLLIPQP